MHEVYFCNQPVLYWSNHPSVIFRKQKASLKLAESPSGNLFSKSITQEMSWVNTETLPFRLWPSLSKGSDLFPTLVPCPPFCEPFNLKETLINDAFDLLNFFSFKGQPHSFLHKFHVEDKPWVEKWYCLFISRGVTHWLLPLPLPKEWVP